MLLEKVRIKNQKLVKLAIIPICVSETLLVWILKNFKVFKEDFYPQPSILYITIVFLVYFIFRLSHFLLKYEKK